MSLITFNARVDPTLPVIVPDAVSFETGASREQAGDPSLFVYEHHGAGFGQADPGALTSFFEDLILGRPFPLLFATHRIRDLDTIFAMALFFDRTLAIHPAMPGVVAAVDIIHRRGLSMLGHIEPERGRFFRLLRSFFPEEGLSKRELGERLTTVVGWIRDHLDGGGPVVGSWPKVKVLDVGSNGFVLAETHDQLLGGWVELYRMGYLRGLLVSEEVDSRRKVLVSRKSAYLDFNLFTAASVFNDMERAMGELPEWHTDGVWLWGPEQGTLILVTHMIELLRRV